MRAACIGFPILHRLHLAALEWIIVTPPVQSSDIPVQARDNCARPRDTPVKSHSAQTKSRTSPVLTSDTQASAIATSASPGVPLALPLPRKCRRRRRKARRAANENSAPRSAAPVTPDECWANQNSGFQRATQHQTEASDPTQMKSAPVYKGQSIHFPHLTQPPIPPTNRNSAFPFGRHTAGNSLELGRHPLGSLLPHSSWYNTRTQGSPSPPSGEFVPSVTPLGIPWNWVAIRLDHRCPIPPGITPGP